MIEVNPRVKDALRSGNYRKNYRIIVLNDDGTTDFTIDNETLVKESVSIDERLCSGDDLKFGLCEGASLEFRYFDHPNIRDRRVQVFIDVQYKDASGEMATQAIPMGYFDIDQCSTQFSTGIIKAVGYNKLRSEYLDEKANDLLIDAFTNPDQQIIFGDIRHILLGGYDIGEKYRREWTNFGEYSPAADYKWFRVGSALTFAEKYGMDAFFNYGTCGDRMTVYPNIYAHTIEQGFAGSGTEYEYLIRALAVKDLEKAEQHVFDTVVGLVGPALSDLGEAFITDLHTNHTKPSAAFQNYNGWKSVCNITVTHGGVSEVYSTVAYKAGESGVAGSIVDFANKTVNSAFGENFTVSITWPYCMRMTYSNTALTPYVEFYFQTSNDVHPAEEQSYWYYVDAELEDYIVKNIVYRWPDGDDCYFLEDVGTKRRPQRLTDYHVDELLRFLALDTTEAEQVVVNPTDLADLTLREVMTATYETVAEFGQLDRTTDLFGGVQLSKERLFPADDLYPSDDLYPQGVAESSFRSQYSKLWTDSVGVQTFRYLIITYKSLVDDGSGNLKEKDVTLQRTVNADGTTDYNCSDNWLFRNLVWTEAQVAEYADAMVEKMRGIKWFPFEMWAAGLPYIEVGDELEINTKDGTYTSYVLQRQMKGIQNLQDTYINGTLDVF